MVGKARSSNFTISEKLDLLKLVKPYVCVLEEHTNKHSVIVEKNKCWDIVSDKYNAIAGGRPERTAQGLRTLYKRLKEYAKQELLQYQKSQHDYEASVSEPTRILVEMIPQITNVCYLNDPKSGIKLRKKKEKRLQRGFLLRRIGHEGVPDLLSSEPRQLRKAYSSAPEFGFLHPFGDIGVAHYRRGIQMLGPVHSRMLWSSKLEFMLCLWIMRTTKMRISNHQCP